MILIGQGTERSEEALQGQFPEVDVLRIDRDTTSRKAAMGDMIAQINRGDPCILVGTQMLAKGHHFPNLGLVLVLDADGGLFSADFRGPEKMAQLLIQVAGRAGRTEQRGRVLIQSHQPDHPQLQLLLQRGYFHFAHELLHLRQIQKLPPIGAMAMVRADATKQESPETFIEAAMQRCNIALPGVRLLGPLPAPMPKRAGKFRAQLHIHADNKAQLKTFLKEFVPILEATQGRDQLHWSLDVDPIDIF
jgi:primosomal protein N' (replication factor Y)